MTVKVITFGKVDLDWNVGGDSIVLEIIGAVVIISTGVGINLVM